MDENNKNYRLRLNADIGEPMDFELTMLILVLVPFAALECWNGHSWELIWNGAVEFEGVAP